MLKTNEMVRKLSIDNPNLCTLSDADIRQVQAILLDMLSDLDALCRKHSLSYLLCAGTALGAVRHQGFIPWDEDVDVGMPRRDYDKLTELLLAEYGDKYWVQSIRNNDHYDLPFLKIRKKGTRFIEIFESDPAHAGVFVDIYPLENVPDFAPWRWLHGIVSDGLQFCCSCVRMRKNKERYFTYFDDPAVHKAVKIKAFLGGCLGFFPLRRWCRLADRWVSCCRKETTRRVTFPSGRKHYFGEMCPRDSFFPPKETPFAGKRFLIPREPSVHLSRLYGDYMTVPSADQQLRHTILELELGEAHV